MQTKAIVFAAILAVASLAPGVAMAQEPGPEFTGASVNILHTGFDAGDLLVRWVETGLTPGETVDYEIGATASATYFCLATGEQACTVGGNISKSFSLRTTKGTIRQTASLDEPDPDSTCTCSGQLVLYEVDYRNISITDTNYGNELDLNGISSRFCSESRLSKCPPPS